LLTPQSVRWLGAAPPPGSVCIFLGVVCVSKPNQPRAPLRGLRRGGGWAGDDAHADGCDDDLAGRDGGA
jgi:hypothetical protein